MVISCSLSAYVAVSVCAGIVVKKNRKDYAYIFYPQCMVALF